MTSTQGATGWITRRVRKVFPRVTFIFGGAASGKSEYAEKLTLKSYKSKHYLATSQVFDAEMVEKVALHTARRGPEWRTHEVPMKAAELLSNLGSDDICLLDCATLWLSNQMLAETDLSAAQDALLQAIDGCAADLVIVSNEVGQGIVPETALARSFREAQGRLNIRLAAQADLVIQVTVGLPVVLKGTLP
mgnify:FL=1